MTFREHAAEQTIYLPPPQYTSPMPHYPTPLPSQHPQLQRHYRPEAQDKHLRMKPTRGSTVLKSGQVKSSTVNVHELKTVKEGEFIGCFNCFVPVTYSTTGNTC